MQINLNRRIIENISTPLLYVTLEIQVFFTGDLIFFQFYYSNIWKQTPWGRDPHVDKRWSILTYYE